MIGSLPTRNTLVSRLSSKIIPLEAPCQGIPDFPVSKGQVVHFLMIGVAQNAVSKNSIIPIKDECQFYMQIGTHFNIHF